MNIKTNKHPILETDLLHKIKNLREQLIETGMKKGLDHEKTIMISQKLDQYIFLYQAFNKDRNDFSSY